MPPYRLPDQPSAPMVPIMQSVCGILLWWCVVAAPLLAVEHPLRTVHQRLPAHDRVTQVTEWNGAAVILTGNPQGLVRQSSPGGMWSEVPTGLPGIDGLHQAGAVSIALAAGRAWRRVALPDWEEIVIPAGAMPSSPVIRVVNGEFWLWTFGGYKWNQGAATLHRSQLYRSMDGLTWTSVTVTPPPGLSAISYSGLAWAQGRYVLTGNAYQNSGTYLQHTGGLWTSPDGTQWERQSEVDGQYTSVAHGNGLWLAGGTAGGYATSTDGAEWVVRQHPFISGYIGNQTGSWPQRSSLLEVGWLPSGFHAVTEDYYHNLIVVSTDGVNWATGTALSYDDFPDNAGLAVVAGKAWLWGKDGTVWRSDDWRWEADRVLPEESSDWTVLMASQSRAVILGNERRAGWSDDGVNWNFADLPGEASRPSVGVWAADRGEFLAVGIIETAVGVPAGVRVWRSPDGTHWGTRTTYGGAAPVGLVRGLGKYVMTLADGEILFSPDGLAWTQGWIDAPPGGIGGGGVGPRKPLRALAFDGRTFVAITARGELAVSTDGVSWQSRPGPESYGQDVGLNLCTGGGLWLVTTGSNSFISDDLIHWSRTGASVDPTGLTFAFGEFISGRGLSSSTDGLVWSRRAEWFSAGFQMTVVAEFKETLLLAGRNGRIFQSNPWRDFIGSWKAAMFTPSQLAAPLISGDEQDPDHDGVPNLLEYALGLDPQRQDAAREIGISRVFYGAADGGVVPHLNLRFPSWELSPGVRVWVERSGDLQSWQRSGINGAYNWYGDKSTNGRYFWNYEIKMDQAQGWLRLRAERP